MFSRRTGWVLTENRFTEAQRKIRAGGRAVLDLTVSNPTQALIEYKAGDILDSLRNPLAMEYEPQAKGLLSARESVAEYYRADHGIEARSESLVLTTSTSEGYSYVLRLLCDADDEILVPKPSYPLFDFLGDLNDVKLAPYALIYDHGWQIDFHTLKQAVSERARAVVVVHPNNPTGSFVSGAERQELNRFCGEHELALIVDEVFLDYARDGKRRESFLTNDSVLTFTLSGLSKISGLPQMKLAWMAVSGPEGKVAAAMERLEIISDTYLSMNAPVQLAAQTNAARLEVEGGWYAVVRMPVIGSDEEVAIELLEKQSVVVHPGHFYDFAGDGYLVISLITPLEEFAEGIRRVLAHLDCR